MCHTDNTVYSPCFPLLGYRAGGDIFLAFHVTNLLNDKSHLNNRHAFPYRSHLCTRSDHRSSFKFSEGHTAPESLRESSEVRVAPPCIHPPSRMEYME